MEKRMGSSVVPADVPGKSGAAFLLGIVRRLNGSCGNATDSAKPCFWTGTQEVCARLDEINFAVSPGADGTGGRDVRKNACVSNL